METVPQKRPRGRPKSLFREGPATTVQALDRGLSVLRDLARTGSATLSDLALRVGMPPSTAHRILATLQNHGFVAFDEASQEWSVGIESFRVGSAYLNRTNIVDAARPVMRRLMEEAGETANLAIADDGDVVYVGQIETQNPVRAFFHPGTRGHMHASGIGKALLAHLPRGEVEKILQKKGLPEFTGNTLTGPDALFAELRRIRERGWSLDDEERYPGMRCIAAAIHNAYGEAVAGISVSGPAVRFPDAAVQEIGPKVKRAAEAVTAIIGGGPAA